MASAHNFRSAFNGFHREDVVHYIEYLNSKHANQVNQLESEKQTLAEELEVLLEKAEQVAALEEECQQLRQRCQELETPSEEDPAEVIAQLRAQLEEVTAQRDAALENQSGRDLTAEELEAYRRAERLERTARERSSQLYRQATSTLAEATGHVDTAAGQFRQIAERLNAQICEMQIVVENSKNALTDAAATLYAIRPEGMEE